MVYHFQILILKVNIHDKIAILKAKVVWVVWGKVVFLHLCAILFTGRVCLQGGLHWGGSASRGVCIRGGGGRLGKAPTISDTMGYGQ